VSDWITLTPRVPITQPIDVGIHPDRYAEMPEADIAATVVVVRGRERAQLGDFFTISGGNSTRVRLEGATPYLQGIGAGMRLGELVVEGNLGSDAGAGLAGGVMHVRGSVGDAAGLAMSGGTLRIDGTAGDRLGGGLPGSAKGMTGGEIVVAGSAGDDAGARIRRGLIVVGGSLGRDAGRSMIAGSIVVLGACGENAGLGSKRGSIVACGGIAIPPTYRYAATYHPPHIRLTMTYLRKRYGMDIDQRIVDAPYRRYCGDAGEPGRGEILACLG
jgi:formylmethanofuran dehydrogenase subunit C